MGSENGYKRSCEGTTNRGTPCKAPALKGKGFCIAHNPRKAVDTPRFQKAGGRPRKPTAAEIYDKWWNENEGAVENALVEALSAERAIVVGTGPKARLEFAPDYELRLKAARELMDRRHGRSSQVHDVTLHEEETVDSEIGRLLGRMRGLDGEEADGVSGRAA